MVVMRMICYGRDLLELGSLPAQLNVQKAKTIVQVEGRIVACLPTVKEAPAGPAHGTIHIFLNLRNGEHVVAAVSTKLDLIALRTTSESAKADDVSTERSVLGSVAAPYAHNAIIGDKDEGLPRLRELSRMGGYLQQARDRLDMVYGVPALIFVPESRLEEVLLKMNPKGLYGALDEDADQIRALALIGRASPN
jgi:hypothetical protein